jgi:hypothetical protein
MLPAPFVPSAIDLRNYPSLPIDINRLLNSDFHYAASDSEWRAGVVLWLRSFHEVPAGSLPDDDVRLAGHAGFGRDVEAWRSVKSQALHGWIKCSDGRLYHKVVCLKVLEAWLDKIGRQYGAAAANKKRWKGSSDLSALAENFTAAIDALANLDPTSRMLRRKYPDALCVTKSEAHRSAITQPSLSDQSAHRSAIAIECKGSTLSNQDKEQSQRVVLLPRTHARDAGGRA